MKRTALYFAAGLIIAALTGCATHGPTPNGGVPPASLGQVGVPSSNGKAQTGSVMIMNRSDMPPAIANKMKR